ATLAQNVADILLESDCASEGPSKGAPTHPTIIERSPGALEPLAGRYFDEKSAAFVDVLFKDDKLWVYGHKLSATSEDRFFFTQHPEATAVFGCPGKDSRTVTIDIGNGPNTYKQVHAIETTTKDLAAYVGTYRSPELDVIWRLDLDEEQLVVQRGRHGTSVLKPICQDVFVDPWVGKILHGNAEWVIAFDRIDGQVSGLRVTASGARGRNLRFNKTS
ncbi:DUF3471 domain-containing protein, partial [Candidatus Bipolaricaulota bacterium]|nr:DUF3471 domain-containing protein [Candidatus Bipolaricaulota bacterium]